MLVFLIGAMVALSTKPCESKTHAVTKCQYAVCNDNLVANAITVEVGVSHDVLVKIPTFAIPDAPLKALADLHTKVIDVPDVQRTETLMHFTFKELSGAEDSPNKLQAMQFY